MQRTTSKNKTTWLLIFLGMSALPVLLFLTLGSGMHQTAGGGATAMMPILLVSGAALVASAVLAFRRLGAQGAVGESPTLPSIDKFYADSIVCLALSEQAPLLGLFILLPTLDGRPYALGLLGGMLVVNLFVILPLGLKYWKALEEKDPG